ncbi:MAG: tetraacyldisaccharide 4'-kinase [Bacteroidota bacterium]|nr:tetraacyldisaccharide 4'-kinase [Bacteroidota bacterium]
MKDIKKILRFLLLYPASVIYMIVTNIRNRMFDYEIFFSERQFSIPIISVGNITVGGTGKTPHIEYLVSLLKDNFSIATLSRGYKRKTRGFYLAKKQSTVNEIGDEPKQIKNKYPEIEVAVDEKRVRGIKKLEENSSGQLDIILLDDAFQHRHVKPGLSVLLIDYTQPMFRDHILPFGRLRENRHEKRRANIIIITKTPHDIKPIEKRILIKNLKIFPFQNLYFTSIVQGSLTHLYGLEKFNIPKEIHLSDNYSVLLLTGIANPEHLIKHVEIFSNDIHELRFADHYSYNKKDIDNILGKFNNINSENKIIVTTEKDAVRLRDVENANELKNLPVFFVPLAIRFHGKDKQEFDNQIITYVRKNKRNSNLHSK